MIPDGHTVHSMCAKFKDFHGDSGFPLVKLATSCLNQFFIIYDFGLFGRPSDWMWFSGTTRKFYLWSWINIIKLKIFMVFAIFNPIFSPRFSVL